MNFRCDKCHEDIRKVGVISTYKHLVLETPDTKKDWNTAVPLWYLCGNCRGMAIKDEVAKEALRIIREGKNK